MSRENKGYSMTRLPDANEKLHLMKGKFPHKLSQIAFILSCQT